MWNIENKEINQLEFIKQKVIDFLEKAWKLKEYKKIIPIKVTNNIFAIKSQTWNISLFFSNKWEYLYWTADIYKHLWKEKYDKYLKKLWYKEIKDKNWYYHMLEIKNNKKIPQESLKYYKIFETLWKIDYKIHIVQTIFDGDKTNKETPKWSIKEFWLTLLKEANKILVKRWIKSWVIKPFEIHYLYHQKQLSDQEKYLKQTLTFKYLSNLINNQAIDLVWEQGSIPVKLDWKKYKINFWPITKEELDYYKAKKWINEKMYKELIKILEEQKKLEKQKKNEEQKHTKKVKKEISGLEDEVKK